MLEDVRVAAEKKGLSYTPHRILTATVFSMWKDVDTVLENLGICRKKFMEYQYEALDMHEK